MLLNYLKIAWRNLRKDYSYAFINVVGLALGLGCAMLIFALVSFHFQTDRHHRNYDRIYQFTSRFAAGSNGLNIQGIPYAFGQAVRNDYPQIETVAMIDEWYSPLVAVPVPNGADKKIKEKNHEGAFVEPAYFQIFDYTWLAGGPERLNEPRTVVMSAEMAKKCFGTTTNIIGRLVRLDARIPARVVGVFADYRADTDLAYSIMVSWNTLKDQLNLRPENEPFDNTNGSTHCYAIFSERFKAADWNRGVLSFVKKYNPSKVKETSYPAVPFGAMHLSPEFGGVSRGLLLSLVLIGILLISTASINFVNLATAQALSRAREVGVRKVLGSTKTQLFWQFIGETSLIVLAAMVLAIGIFHYGQTLAHIHLHGLFRFTFYFSPSIISWLALLAAIVILLAGLYPALILAGFRPVAALTGQLPSQQAGGFSIRKALVVAQFAISQTLIIGLIVVVTQLSYVQQKDLGFRKDAILTVSLPNLPAQDVSKMRTFKNLALAISDVDNFSYSMSGPPQSGWTSQTKVRFDDRANEESYAPQQAWVDADYVDLYDLKLIAGRNLHPSESIREALINETFLQHLGFSDPEQVIGKILHRGPISMQIVGVLKDYHQLNLRQRITPMFLSTFPNGFYAANIRLGSVNYEHALKQLEKAYNQVYSDSFFDPEFVDDQIQQTYQQEQTLGKLINFFTIIALLIGCMGLYGLVLFMAARRTKEVGVRKVLGASVGSILWLFSREFVSLVGIAFVLAAPLAWWVMKGWLANFQYKVSITPGIFLLALLATMVVALVTISFQGIKTALTNPAISLRSE